MSDWLCPECGVASPSEEWTEIEVPCDECGDHGGSRCPKCGEDYDDVYGQREAELKARGLKDPAQ